MRMMALAGSAANDPARDRLVMGIVLIAAALFLFVDAETAPIVLWDESRNVANALEMRHSGFSLVTTYGFEADLWNTKPPLLIWLMTASVAIFGPSEWALRLPSALAALGTLLLVMTFVRRTTGSMRTGALAGLFLLLSPGFFGEHGARTADYDALLVFFTTAYLHVFFFAVHRRRRDHVPLILAGLLVAGAVLTKSTAGLIPGVGIGLYLLVNRRTSRLWQGWRFASMAAVAAAPILLFYGAREMQAPGFIEAAWHNDLAGRFRERITGPWLPPWTYAEAVLTGWFFAGPLLLALPLAWRHVRGKSRAALIYTLCVAGAFLLVISLSSTRLLHYALPAFPPLAAAAAILVRALAGRFVPALAAVRRPGRAFTAVVVLTGLLVMPMMARAVDWRYRLFPERQSYAQAMYGKLFARLADQGITDVDVVEPGHRQDAEMHYAPLLRSYKLLWIERGLKVRHIVRREEARAAMLASCDPATTAQIRQEGTDLSGVAGCAAIRRLALPARSPAS